MLEAGKIGRMSISAVLGPLQLSRHIYTMATIDKAMSNKEVTEFTPFTGPHGVLSIHMVQETSPCCTSPADHLVCSLRLSNCVARRYGKLWRKVGPSNSNKHRTFFNNRSASFALKFLVKASVQLSRGDPNHLSDDQTAEPGWADPLLLRCVKHRERPGLASKPHGASARLRCLVDATNHLKARQQLWSNSNWPLPGRL